MVHKFAIRVLCLQGLFVGFLGLAAAQEEPKAVSFAMIDGNGPDWVSLGKEDFVRANCNEDTWVWDGSTVHCTGKPIGVLRSAK